MVRNTSFSGVQPLTSPDYADFDQIGRCVHFDDFQETQEKGRLVPQRLSNSQIRLNDRVLWFAPCQPMTSHNFYGNVTFVINWSTVLQNLGPYLYLIDQAIYNARSYTRVVFTRNNYDHRLRRVDLHSDGSPMTASISGYQHATHCFNKQRHGPHELQIAIEVTDADTLWILQNCTPMANDHSLANTPSYGNNTRKDGTKSKYESYKCFKFNTAQNRECPYEMSREDCDKRIQATTESRGVKHGPSGTFDHSFASHTVSPTRVLSARARRLSSKERQPLAPISCHNPNIPSTSARISSSTTISHYSPPPSPPRFAPRSEGRAYPQYADVSVVPISVSTQPARNGHSPSTGPIATHRPISSSHISRISVNSNPMLSSRSGTSSRLSRRISLSDEDVYPIISSPVSSSGNRRVSANVEQGSISEKDDTGFWQSLSSIFCCGLRKTG